LFLFPLPGASSACFIAPEPEALVDIGLSSIRTPLEVSWFGAPGDRSCAATLNLSVSTLPSRSLAPRPREIAEELAPVAAIGGAERCSIRVWVVDDIDPGAEDAGEPDPDQCWIGEFRFDGGSWWSVEEDATCW
jgi:hypothetical protein